MPRVPKDKFKNNPLVSIDGARVRAAIEEGGYSVMGVARAIGEDHRTLDSIVQGKQARTRKRRLKKLSKFLNVSEAWLSGEDEAPVDALPPWDLGEPAVLVDVHHRQVVLDDVNHPLHAQVVQFRRVRLRRERHAAGRADGRVHAWHACRERAVAAQE